jgi:nitrite reductase/ring-hydroxylating ferredoxin subunit
MAEAQRLVCTSRELVDGGRGVRFELTESDPRAVGFVIRYKGSVKGYVNRCGHLPTQLDAEPGRFFDTTMEYLICTLHGATYSPATGACLGGPCNKKGLVPLVAWESGGSVFVKWDSQPE